MLTTINWGALVAQNRAKAVGIPWTKEEKEALARGISPESVRAGILDTKEAIIVKELEEAKELMDKNIKLLTIRDLSKVAKMYGIEFVENDATRASLMSEIEKVKKMRDRRLLTRKELASLAKKMKLEFVYKTSTREQLLRLVEEAERRGVKITKVDK